MRFIKELANLQDEFKKGVLTLGNYDGVHLGHQEIIKRVIAKAKELNGPSVVFTFQEHPLKILAHKKCPPLLTTLEEKFSILEELGLDVVVCIPFNHEIASISADKFVTDIISNLLNPRWIVVGHDYAFGKNRTGNIDLLKRWSQRLDFQVEVVDVFKVEGETVSSTIIRQKIADGQIQEAARLLGRPYLLQSEVVLGQQKAKGLPFRTANLGKQSKLLPGYGVYAVKVLLGKDEYNGVANIGCQPTYGQNDLQVEVHILDFTGELYGALLKVSFIAKLREELKFSSESALKKQIEKDIYQARQILANG